MGSTSSASTSATPSTSSARPSSSSLIILVASAIVNIFRTHLLAVINNVSVWWHVVGVAVIIALLVIVPDTHQSFSFVFGERLNNCGFDDGATGGLFFWIYLLPIGFLLTQYTITGFDASAHLSEETHGASKNAARGVWTSIFYSAIIGWLVLLAITFAVQSPGNISDAENGFGVGSVFAVLAGALDTAGFKAVLVICTVGQLFCGLACLTSASRMCFAFSRDRGMPGSRHLSKVNKDGVPFNAVMAMAALALIITHPGAVRRPRDGPAGRVLRRDLDLRDRALHLLRDPDLPALADGERVRAGVGLEPRKQVALDEPDQLHLGRDHLHRRPAADEPARGAVGRPVGRELRELRADRAPG